MFIKKNRNFFPLAISYYWWLNILKVYCRSICESQPTKKIVIFIAFYMRLFSPVSRNVLFWWCVIFDIPPMWTLLIFRLLTFFVLAQNFEFL